MKIYIAGKIGNLPKWESERKFKLAADFISSLGHDPVNPTLLEHVVCDSWYDCMIADLKSLFQCEGIYMLNDWKDSRGARIEHAVASELNMKIFYEPVNQNTN